MNFSAENIAGLIDISAVQASHGKAELDKLAAIAKKYKFIAVHSLPSWVPYLKKQVEGSGVLTGGPVGFPSGGHTTEVKVLEAELLVRDGADEMDMMLNVGKMKAGDYSYVLNDIKSVIAAADGLPVKVIMEVHYLSDDEIKRACELSIQAGAAFVKTGTGWTSSGATIEKIRLITGFVGDAIEVKASGGVRGLSMLKEMYELGVTRFGINAESSISIIEEVQNLPGGAVEMTRAGAHAG